MYKTLNAPHVVQIEVSSMCPNSCVHCYNFWRQEDKKSVNKSTRLSLEQVDLMMDQLIHNKVFHIVLTGGEPLMNKKALFRILERAFNSGITVGINSTLISLNESDAIKFKEFGVQIVLTSILGPSADIHDKISQRNFSFEKTIKGVSILQKVGVPVAVNMVISKKNLHLLNETALFVKSLGIRSFNATRAGCPGNCSDFSEISLDLFEFRSYLEELHLVGIQEKIPVDILSSYPLCGIKEVDRYQEYSSRRCMAGVNTFTISQDGEVRPCGHFDINYGNLFKEDLSLIWQRMTEWRDGSLIPLTCNSCKVLPWCGGGCRMEAKMRNNSSSELDPYASIEDVNYVFEQLSSRKKETKLLPKFVRLNSKIRWRPESFGATFFVGARFGCYLNSEGLKFILSLPKEKELEVDYLLNKLKQNQENFILGLIERNILVS